MSDHIIERIYRSILWLEGKEKSSVPIMAEIACLSPYHFSRVFYSMTGMSPALYWRRRVLTKAAQSLLSTNQSILDMALEYGYETQESFTRAFKDMFGVNPGQLRKSSIDLEPLYQKPLTQEGLQHFKTGGLNLQPEYKEHPAIKVCGVSGIIDYDGVWQANHIWSKYLQKYDQENEITYGVCQGTIDSGALAGQLTYLAGHPCNKECKELEIIDIQSGNYAVFTHNGALKDFGSTLQYIWQIWVPRSDIELREAPDFEVYDEGFDSKTLEGKIELWIPITG